MKYSTIKEIYTFCEDLGIDARGAIEEIINDNEDFNVDGYRIINSSDIDRIQQDELSSDPYILGCFNAWFIAENTNLSIDIIEALQKGEQYDALGKHIINNNQVEDIQDGYKSADGYGHHFAHYDHNEHEIYIDGETWYFFRVD